MTPTEAWTAVLVGLVAAYRRPETDGRALAAHLEKLVAAAAPQFKASGARKATVQALLRQVAAGRAPGTDGMPRLQYATDLRLLKQQMQAAVRDVVVQPDVPERLAKTIRAAVLMLTPDTARVDKRDAALNRTLSAVPDGLIRAAFSVTSLPRQADALREATHLVRRMTGRAEPRLGASETKEAKAKYPKTYARYLQVQAMIRQAYQDHVRNAARAAGGYVPIGETIRDMREAGITHHPYAGLEKLYLNEDGKLHTSAPHRLITAMPAPGSRIFMNPDYDPRRDESYVFRFRVPGSKRDEGETSPAYTQDAQSRGKDARFGLVARVSQQMPALRAKWLRDLRSPDPTTRRLAAMTELLYSQAMRIGDKSNAVDGKSTYGLSTLLVSHVALRDGSAVLRYPGKDAIQQKHVVKAGDPEHPETDAVLRVLRDVVQGKRATDRVWTDARGAPITNADVNAYLRDRDIPISAHKFRHLRASVLMARQLERLRIPRGSSQQQIERLVKDAAVHVGMALGHMRGDTPTAATAIKSYVPPRLLADFFKSRNLRVPHWVPEGGRGDDD